MKPLARALLVCCVCHAAGAAARAQLLPQKSNTSAEFRSMHAASPNVVWAAGKGGHFAVTTDGGATWRADSVAGAADLFLTGVWARDARIAYVVGTSFDGGLARIYRTNDGGVTWTKQWERAGEGVFFDALRCWNVERCIAFGDPVAGTFVVARTENGRTWTEIAADKLPPPLQNEAAFAASGTTLATWGTRRAWIATGGGARARVYATSDGGATWRVADTPLRGNSTSGIFGIAFRDSLNGVAVGGDYQRPMEQQQNVLRTKDGGRTWELVGSSLPAGVRYGAAYATGGPVRGALLTVGPSGVGISLDDGATWIPFDNEHYNTLAFASSGDAWIGGPDGRLAKLPAAVFEGANAGVELRRRGARDTTKAAPDAPAAAPAARNAPAAAAAPAARAGDAAAQAYPTRFSPELAAAPMVRDALAWLEQNFPAQLEEWVRITEIPAQSRHEQQRAAYIRRQLEAEGFVVTTDSIGNVIARRPGTGGGETVVIAAHMDTVHPLDTDVTVRRDSAEVNGRRAGVLRAPGVFDNSASVANMLAVARALNRSGVRTRGDILLIATVQEELGLLGMDYWLEHNPGVADVVVALDGGLPNVNYGALGIHWTRYTFAGEGSHTNSSPGKPHPARALADAITAIYEIDIPEHMGGAVYNVGMLSGGKIFNAIPEEVSFTMDLRSVNPILLDDLDAQIDSAVARAAAAHRVRWRKEQTLRNRAGGTEQMLADRRRHPLIQTAVDTHQHLGITARAIASGSTDANAAVVRGIPAISIGRAFGGDQHTLSEWSEIDSALTATKIALLIALAMAGLSAPGT